MSEERVPEEQLAEQTGCTPPVLHRWYDSTLTHINRVRQISDELKSMDVNIDEAEVAMAVLNGLPPKYDRLIVALDALGDDTKLTLEFTKSHLLQEEQRKTERSVRRETVAKVNMRPHKLGTPNKRDLVDHPRFAPNTLFIAATNPAILQVTAVPSWILVKMEGASWVEWRAERLNRTLLDSARAMLKHMDCEKLWWAEAVSTECYI
jgi:gag-polypeptide of LTR copia-type